MSEADLTPQQRDELLDGIARRVVEWHMETPVVLFLEMHRPLSFIAGQSLLVAIPFLGALFDARQLSRLAALLQSSDNIDRLIERIEALAGHDAAPAAASPKGSG